MTSDTAINPVMITLARESRELTQTELARQLGMSQAMLSKIEAGFKTPTESVVSRLSMALRYPKSFFSQTDPVLGPGLSEFFHRRRQDVGVKVLSRIHAQINIIRMQVTRLLRSVETPSVTIRPLDIDGGPAEVARAMRAAWQLPDGPVANVIRTIENAGGIVIRYPFGTPQVDAISRWVPGLPPLFFVNEGLPTDRERLTLCHELGHLVMHDMPNDSMEAEANQFAAEFLMPQRDVSPHLDRVTLERLARLKPYWRVSMAALLVRARDLKKLSAKSSATLWKQMSARGFKRREPAELNLAPETPPLLQRILEIHREDFGYGLDELSEMLAADADELASTYKLEQRQPEVRAALRVVAGSARKTTERARLARSEGDE
jgi:Zn-dependent peptidase ImmA (M78 family)/transcriptional regulator with XRE-family HTH domain